MGRASGELSSAYCLWLWCLVICYSRDSYFPCFLMCIIIQGKKLPCQYCSQGRPRTSDYCFPKEVVCPLPWYILLLVAQNSSYAMLQKKKNKHRKSIKKLLCIWWLISIKIYILTRSLLAKSSILAIFVSQFKKIWCSAQQVPIST